MSHNLCEIGFRLDEHFTMWLTYTFTFEINLLVNVFYISERQQINYITDKSGPFIHRQRYCYFGDQKVSFLPNESQMSHVIQFFLRFICTLNLLSIKMTIFFRKKFTNNHQQKISIHLWFRQVTQTSSLTDRESTWFRVPLESSSIFLMRNVARCHSSIYI